MSKQLYNAATSHFEAQRQEALAMLEIYLTKSVGVGDHSSVLEDVKTWTRQLAEAEGALRALDESFKLEPSSPPPDIGPPIPD